MRIRHLDKNNLIWQFGLKFESIFAIKSWIKKMQLTWKVVKSDPKIIIWLFLPRLCLNYWQLEEILQIFSTRKRIFIRFLIKLGRCTESTFFIVQLIRINLKKRVNTKFGRIESFYLLTLSIFNNNNNNIKNELKKISKIKVFNVF